MKNILTIIQLVISILLIVLIMLQAQGTGLGNMWSGGGETYHTRRGVEKIIYYLTIVAIAIFIVTSLLLLKS